MKLKKIILLILISCFAAAAACLFAACSSSQDYSDRTKVVFELEGATYKNSSNPIVHYYNVEKGEKIKIYAPDDLANSQSLVEYRIERSGYDFLGWFRTKTASGEYQNQWDFEKDTVGEEGITLYAGWRRQGNHKYGVYYKDETTGEDVKLGEYSAKEGDKFRDRSNFYVRAGYTKIRYTDADGNEWDDNFRFPQFDEDTELKVYVEYIEGDYKIVSTAAELNAAYDSNIYLLNDIDCKNGRDFTGFGSRLVKTTVEGSEVNGLFTYSHVFLGNGHKISNVNISINNNKNDMLTDDVLGRNFFAASLFGKLQNATVRDVTLENISLNIDFGFANAQAVYVAPLAVYAKDSVIKNVHFTGTYTETALPQGGGFDREEDFHIAENSLTLTGYDSGTEEGTGEEQNTASFTGGAAANIALAPHTNNVKKKEE